MYKKYLIAVGITASILSTSLLPMSAFGEETFNQCVERKKSQATTETQPFSIEGGVRCYSCKRCWFGGKPEHKNGQAVYNAPPGYTIVGDVPITVLSANKGGYIGPVNYQQDEEGRVYRVYVDMWCESVNKPLGAGAWRHISLTGNIQKINVTAQDVLSIMQECMQGK